ncbi:META domain-containing protein [Flexivirga alba]|uniref:META domain-containing protein n=1 Tax=Flexivirga alba TaxID=702742 RepID=A0ABW2AF50_9MICO
MHVDAGRSIADGSLADRLAGRTFLSRTVIGRDLVPGSAISVDFGADRRLHVYAGCNHMSGDLRFDGPRLSVERMSTTEMRCERSLLDQDGWLASLLQPGLDAHLNGDALTLTGEGVTLQLMDRRAADPDRPLENTVWALRS